MKPRSSQNEGSPSRENVAAAQVYRLADELASRAEELVREFRDTNQTTLDITRKVFPEMQPDHVDVYRGAVGLAIRRVMSKKEIDALTTARRIRKMVDNVKADPGKYSEAGRRCGKLRGKTNMEPTWRAKGIEPWGEGEREKLLELSDDPAFQHTKPNLRGRPDYQLIADYLNEHFHGGREARTGVKLRSVVISNRFDNKEKPGKQSVGNEK